MGWGAGWVLLPRLPEAEEEEAEAEKVEAAAARGVEGSELGGAASACAPPLLGRRCVRGAFSDPRARGKAGKRVGPGWGQISSGRRRRRGPELASLGGERPGDRESAREPRPAGSARRGGQGG